MKFHQELNPKLWDKNNEEYKLQDEVKAKLEEIATAFIEYLDIPADAILDKVITGSSASYNYTEFSDLDLHIIVDFDKVHKDCPVVEGYLSAMKSTFNKEHDIFIHGIPVELYAEKKDQGTVHNGLYSLQTGWIDIPQKIEPTDNDAAVEAKYNELKELIDKCETAEVADELLDKIYTMRKAGLADAGEFCTENLAFKKLRNEGCMDKLRQLKKQEVDKQLSLESYNEQSQNVKFDADKIHELIEQGKIKPIRFSNIKIGDRLLTYNGMYCQGILKVEKKDTLRDNEGRFMVEVTGTREEPAARACGCNAFDYGDGSFLIVSDDVLQTDIIQDNNIKEENCNEALQAGEDEIVQWLKQRQVKVGHGFNKLSKEATAYYMAKLINSLNENIINKIKEADFSNFNTREFTLENKQALEAAKIVPCNSTITHLVCLYINPETNKTYNEKPTEEETLRRSIKIKMNKLYNKKTGWMRKGYYCLECKDEQCKIVKYLGSGQGQKEEIFVGKSLQEINNYLDNELQTKQINAPIEMEEDKMNEAFRKLSKAEQEIEKILNDNGFKASAIETQKGEYVKLYYIDKEEILTGNQITDKYVEGKNFKEVLKKVKELFAKNESINESTKKYRSVVADDKYTRLRDLYGRRGRKRTLHVKATGGTKQFLSGPKKEYKDIKTGELFYLADNSDVMTDIMGEPYTKFEIITESFEKPLDKEEFKIKVTLSNGKERYYKAKDLQAAKMKFSDLCIRFNNCELLQGDKVLYKQNESIKEDYEWRGPVAKITFDNGEVITTCINGTDEEIKAYYMNNVFNLGREEDDMHKVVNVEVIRESIEDVHSNFKSMAKRIVRDFKVKGYPKSNKFYMDFAKEAVEGFKKDWGHDVRISTGNGELILTLEDTYQAVIDAQTHKIKFSDLENSNYMFENKIMGESLKESLQDQYRQAFDLLVEGENIVATLNTDFGKQFVKDVESLYEIKSYKSKLRKAKDLLMNIHGYLIDEQYDGYNAKIDKFINNNKNESIKEEYPASREELINKHNGCITIDDVTLEVSNLYNKKQDDYSNGYGKSYCVSNGKDSKVFINFDKAINHMKKLNNKNEELKKVENMEINEGMWASPFTVKNAEKVARLLANPITLGELNSEEKQKELWNVIGDDGFWDAVANEATVEPDCDARPLIISNLEAWIDNKENFRDGAYNQEAEDIIVKAIAKFDNNSKKLTESKNVYKPSTILKALDIERNWYKEIGLGEDEKAPQVMFFIIDNDEIKDTKLVDRQDVYTYKPQANEYYLDRTRDSGFDITDYNLSHVQKMVDSWNEGKKFEDVDSLCDKIDNATSDLQALIKSLAPTKNAVVESINKCLAEALEEEIWGVEMFLDTVDGDPEPGHVEFTRDSLIDFLNDYGYELSKDASDEEIKECAEDYEMTIKYIRKPN